MVINNRRPLLYNYSICEIKVGADGRTVMPNLYTQFIKAIKIKNKK